MQNLSCPPLDLLVQVLQFSCILITLYVLYPPAPIQFVPRVLVLPQCSSHSSAHHFGIPSLLTAFWSTHLSIAWLMLACMLPVTSPLVPFSHMVSPTPTTYPCQQSKSSYDYIWQLSKVYNFCSTSGFCYCVSSIYFCHRHPPLPPILNEQWLTFASCCTDTTHTQPFVLK